MCVGVIVCVLFVCVCVCVRACIYDVCHCVCACVRISGVCVRACVCVLCVHVCCVCVRACKWCGGGRERERESSDNTDLIITNSAMGIAVSFTRRLRLTFAD